MDGTAVVHLEAFAHGTGDVPPSRLGRGINRPLSSPQRRLRKIGPALLIILVHSIDGQARKRGATEPSLSGCERASGKPTWNPGLDPGCRDGVAGVASTAIV